MKASRIFFVLIMLALLFAEVAPMPAQAATTTNSVLTVTNKTPGPVTITLTGPKTYRIYSTAGVTTQEIIKGKYDYAYTACGQTKKGKMTATGAKVKLNIAPCQMGKVLWVNQSSTTLRVSLTGPQNMRITVSPHSYQLVSLYKGDYQFSASWCDGTATRTFKLGGKYVWRFWGC